MVLLLQMEANAAMLPMNHAYKKASLRRQRLASILQYCIVLYPIFPKEIDMERPAPDITDGKIVSLSDSPMDAL